MRSMRRCTRCVRAAPPSVERDDVVRSIADRLNLEGVLAADLQATGSSQAQITVKAPQRLRRTPWEHDARLLLGFCLLLPDAAPAVLADLDMAHFDGASLGDAARYVRRQAEGESTPEEAHEWAPLIAELDALAAREQPSLRAMEELAWKLRLHALEAELKKLGQNAEMPLSQQTQLQELQKLRLSYLESLESVRAQAPDQ